MARYLCISVTLLDRLFHGTGDNKMPEWPPSPMRLFQALVAGTRTGCRNGAWSDVKAAAFRWLECREPPLIVGPVAERAAGYTLFVPNNDADKKFDRQDRLTSKIVRPQRIANDLPDADARGTLHYLWAIPEDEWPKVSTYVKLLCDEARHLMALGWGIDQAIADGRVITDSEAARLPGPRWRAWRTHRPGQQLSRIPVEGSLTDLEEVHSSFVSRIDGNRFNPPRKLKLFGEVAYLRAGALPSRSYAVFELPDGIAFRQEDAVAVAAMLRSLACNKANQRDFQQQFPDVDTEVFLAGHINRKQSEARLRLSYLPLPTIGHSHADGLIRRVLIVEPHGGNGSHVKWAQQRLRNQVLHDHDGNERGTLLGLWRGSSSAMLDKYVGQHKNWSSVTPVILPGFDDGKRAKAEKLFLQAVRRVRLPLESIADFTLRKAPFWPGSQHPDCYRRPDYLDSAKNRRFSAWHIHLSFREPIIGPLSVGAGRHCGLGVFAASRVGEASAGI